VQFDGSFFFDDARSSIAMQSSFTLPNGMQPAYAETLFRVKEGGEDCPQDFAIITAYATTGEEWSTAENQAADRALHADLDNASSWLRRATGYSPTTHHEEPGWATAMSFDTACDIGRVYKQDAIYYVKQDKLFVSYCDKRRSCIEIGSFSERVRGAAKRNETHDQD
jgi:hypothetical protein